MEIRIPGTSFKIGIDPLLGLAPGFGDAVATVLAGWILVRAAGLGASPATLVRMAGNLLLDGLIGAVPVLGDVFDVGFRANHRNVALLERQLAAPAEQRRTDLRLLIAVAVAAALVPVGLVALLGYLVFAALRAVGW